ncbi:MAG: LD-carboxypeptidase [Candidatus Micrarchaeales archaeon]|jgi:muramoyltetrapeptide carboxypeptidase|uniref:Peptidase U61 LD-carboxypeptidase A n=1 Tax=Candidatus Micrarchaeum acidiphilum ARMAN-2 TaxID=425595 RepID=C7DIG6_MICA2|nr:MAG: peptidase U61 LD-carboxypeptidase A [Candidatus Micrarchaeum acidiphilum ARMAN-2]MCW6160994.1 LD-carboxypeptidase [Candidatus Micrarchaeales archaeon]
MHEPIVKPAALKPGSLIKIIAPSFAVSNETNVPRAIEFLKKQGFRVSTSTGMTHAAGTRYYTSGDRLRKNEIEAAFKNDEVDAIMAFRGGAGAIDLLNMIDYDVIKDHPKIFVGSSDITLLQLAFMKKANLVTFQGPMFIDIMTEKDDAILNYNWSTFLSVVQRGDKALLKNPIGARTSKTIVEGTAKGRIVGGNMTMFTLIAGTEYMPEIENRILFLEDVNVEPWMVDNLLNSIILKGLIQKCAGVVFGGFPHEGLEELANSLDASSFLFKNLMIEDYMLSAIQDIIYDIMAKKIEKLPSFLEFTCCHGRHITTVPLGVKVELNSVNRTIEMLESAVD